MFNCGDHRSNRRDARGIVVLWTRPGVPQDNTCSRGGRQLRESDSYAAWL